MRFPLQSVDGSGNRASVHYCIRKEIEGQEMKLNKLIAIVILVLLVGMVAWGCWNWLSPKKATPTVDLPVGDDMATQIKKGTTIYTTANVPAFVLDGTSTFTTDFSATVKVMDVLDTRTIRVEILSPTTFEQQAGYMGYPQIITGRSYDVVGVLQHPWQDYPLIYIPTAAEFQQNPDDSVNNQMLLA